MFKLRFILTMLLAVLVAASDYGEAATERQQCGKLAAAGK